MFYASTVGGLKIGSGFGWINICESLPFMLFLGPKKIAQTMAVFGPCFSVKSGMNSTQFFTLANGLKSANQNRQILLCTSLKNHKTGDLQQLLLLPFRKVYAGYSAPGNSAGGHGFCDLRVATLPEDVALRKYDGNMIIFQTFSAIKNASILVIFILHDFFLESQTEELGEMMSFMRFSMFFPLPSRTQVQPAFFVQIL